MTVLLGAGRGAVTAAGPPHTRPGVLLRLVQFYRRPGQVQSLLVASLILSYCGGAVMFWFHGIYRGEQGPAISAPVHWLLDSTLGFVGLTPALALLLPLADEARTRIWAGPGARHLALLVGPSFALVTGPGPLVHNLLVGRGAPLANLATDLLGRDDAAAQAVGVQHPVIQECLLQVLVGVPLYTVLLLATLTATARVTQSGRRAPGTLSPAILTPPPGPAGIPG